MEEGYALYTNLNRFFYGRATSTDIIQLSTVQRSTEYASRLYFDNVGALSLLSFEMTPAYSSVSSMFPIGFLQNPSGALRTGFILKSSFATHSDVKNVDDSFPSSLAPVFVGFSKMQFYVNGASSFASHHRGYVVKQQNGGAVLIQDVSDDGKLISGIVQTDFVSDTVTQTPALAGTLTISGLTSADLGDVTSPTVTTSTSVTLVATLGSTVTSWSSTDVGKTIVFNRGSFLITAVPNPSTVTALVVARPLSLTAATPGTWSAYDFRTEISYTTDSNQLLTISSGPGTFMTATLASGSFAFTDDCTIARLGPLLTY